MATLVKKLKRGGVVGADFPAYVKVGAARVAANGLLTDKVAIPQPRPELLRELI